MGSCLSTDGGGSSHGCCSIPCAPSSVKKRDKKNKTSLQAAAAEAQTDAHLARIPGRMCMNGSSDIACMFTQQGRKGTNQDAMVVWEEFGSNKDTVFCGVFDGHGPFGHLVAKRVRDSLPSKLCSHWEAITRGDEGNNNIREAVSAVGSLNSDETASITMDEEWKEAEGEDTEGLAGKAPDMLTAWKESFLKAFKVMDKELRFHPTIDCFCSGTTAVTLLKQVVVVVVIYGAYITLFWHILLIKKEASCLLKSFWKEFRISFKHYCDLFLFVPIALPSLSPDGSLFSLSECLNRINLNDD